MCASRYVVLLHGAVRAGAAMSGQEVGNFQFAPATGAGLYPSSDHTVSCRTVSHRVNWKLVSLTKEGDKYALVYDTPEGRVQVGHGLLEWDVLGPVGSIAAT